MTHHYICTPVTVALNTGNLYILGIRNNSDGPSIPVIAALFTRDGTRHFKLLTPHPYKGITELPQDGDGITGIYYPPDCHTDNALSLPGCTTFTFPPSLKRKTLFTVGKGTHEVEVSLCISYDDIPDNALFLCTEADTFHLDRKDKSIYLMATRVCHNSSNVPAVPSLYTFDHPIHAIPGEWFTEGVSFCTAAPSHTITLADILNGKALLPS